jgi:membrane associated rhomboid family serine protease
MSDSKFKFHNRVVAVPIGAVVLIWLIYSIEIGFGFNFNSYGIYPRTFSGLKGIFFSPFIHSNTTHLFNNTVPLAVMLGCLYYFYNKIATGVLLFGILFTGLLTWILGRPSYHIGASGIIYLLVSFIFFSGIFRKYYRLIALSLVVVFLYGSMVWYIFPIEERISWEGHLSGFLIGFIFAYWFKHLGPQPEEFQFSKTDEFDSLFDENGNFVAPETDENNDLQT